MIFVDPWAWVAIANRRDSYHQAAADEFDRLLRIRTRLVTSSYVLDETISDLYRTVGAQAAGAFVQKLMDLLQVHRLVHVTAAQFEAAWQLRLKYQDKPNISFTDLTSMVIMRDLGITGILTGDRHFEHVGLGFRLLPQQT